MARPLSITARPWGLRVFVVSMLVPWASARADLTLTIEPDQIRVAQPLILTVTSDTPGMTWPDWAEALPGWEVAVRHADELRATLTLRSYLPGEIAIPAIAARSAGGVAYQTDERTVSVTSVLAEDADVSDAAVMKPEAGALQVPGTGSAKGIVGLFALGLAVIAGGMGLLMWRRRQAQRKAPAMEVDRALQAAEQQQDAAQAVWAVRRAAELASGQSLSAQTASDLADDPAALAGFSSVLHDKLVAFLREAEAARHDPSGDTEHAQVIQAARGLVRDTREWVLVNASHLKGKA